MNERRVIVFMSRAEAADLKQALDAFAATIVQIAPDSANAASRLARATGDALITTSKCPVGFEHMGEEGWFDYLNGLNQRFRVVVVGSLPETIAGRNFRKLDFVPIVEGLEGVLVRLRAHGILQPEVVRKIRSRIPELNVDELCSKLRQDSVLSVVCINATKLRKLGTSLGGEVFDQVLSEVRKSLLEMWGEAGSFRADDVLCHKREDSLIFYVVLNAARGRDQVPAPGVLERLSERLSSQLLGRLWKDVGNRGKAGHRAGLPSCVKMIPEIAAGHATVIYNPCVNNREQIVQLMEAALDSSRGQLVRVADRQRELLLTIIKSDELLEPAYQAVFNMRGLDLNNESMFENSGAISAFKSEIFGFESLIRIRTSAFDRRFWPDPVSFFEGRIMQPDVLFALAHHAHLSLELDQACLKHAQQYAKGLPGALMVNILPRNLYHVEAIREMIPGRGNVVLEVSESEEIGNFDKLGEVCASLRSQHYKIAADDFGKGFAGLDRILKMRPDIIKIDRSLITHIDEDQARQTLLKSLMVAAKVAGAMVLAEGIERVEEARFCQANGVDLAQGFFFHKPQFRTELNQLLERPAKSSGSAGGGADDQGNGRMPGVA